MSSSSFKSCMTRKDNFCRKIISPNPEFNFSPNDKLLDWSKLKAFADVK